VRTPRHVGWSVDWEGLKKKLVGEKELGREKVNKATKKGTSRPADRPSKNGWVKGGEKQVSNQKRKDIEEQKTKKERSKRDI